MRFIYGDVVVVTEAAVKDARTGQACAVVAMTQIETEEQSRIFGHPVGIMMYTVEFGDGKDALIPEGFLRPL